MIGCALAPLFVQYEFFVLENVTTPAMVGSIIANKAALNNSNYQYTILSPTLHPFFLNGSTLSVLPPLDTEANSSFSLFILIEDTKGRRATGTVVVQVRDVNEFTPSVSGNFSIDRILSVDTLVGVVPEIIDADFSGVVGGSISIANTNPVTVDGLCFINSSSYGIFINNPTLLMQIPVVSSFDLNVNIQDTLPPSRVGTGLLHFSVNDVVMESLRFGNTGSYLTATFSTDVTHGSLATEHCDLVDYVDAASLSLLGTNPGCALVNGEFFIFLGTDASVVPGQSITFEGPNVIVSADGSNWYIGGPETVLPPDTPLIPNVIVSAPSTVGCDDIVVQAFVSGLAGREGTYAWRLINVTSDGDTTASETALLDLFSSSSTDTTVTLASSSLVDFSEYVFGLSVTNFFGQQSQERVWRINTTDTSSPVPILVVNVAAEVYRSQGVTIRSRISLASCMNESESLAAVYEYAWVQLPGSSALVLGASSTSHSLIIAGNVLEVGQTYTFELTVTNLFGGLSATTSASFDVFGSDLLARIVGGDRSVSRMSSVVLRSGSIDPDEINDGQYEYLWACTNITSMPHIPCNLSNIDTTNTSFSFPPSLLIADGIFQFSLNYSHPSTGVCIFLFCICFMLCLSALCVFIRLF